LCQGLSEGTGPVARNCRTENDDGGKKSMTADPRSVFSTLATLISR
jgi:hypothetical protein